jgi:hypothetical protein
MSISQRGIIPVMGARMSAAGRLDCVARGVGKTGAGKAVTGAEALAALLAAGAAFPVPRVGGGGVAAALALEAGVAAAVAAVAPDAGVAVGLAVTVRREVPGAVGAAAPADEAARLAAAVLGGAAVTAGAWPPAAAWPPEVAAG